METGEVWKYHMRLRVYRTERSFGPGVSTLMRLVEEKGSLSAACKEMGMAYSKAWKIVKAAEKDLGFALMEGSSGGESGGKTVLTEKGKDFLERYLRFEAEVQQKADEVFERYFGAGEDRKEGE
ncbi:MAG: LysR family transcriptional regulator [Hungatella hathewayi]|nr:LysR family transcriptional regulator [Hungatella hathewayi]